MFTEELAPFFQDMATSAMLNGVPVTGIFQNAYADEELNQDMLAASRPIYLLPSVEVPANVVGLLLLVAGLTFKVVATMPDGTGVTLLQLRK